jgi:uncharacterized membrane protein
MPRLSKNQTGFSIVETVLVVVIVGAIAGVGWYVYHADQKTSDTYNAATENSNNVSPTFKAKKAPAAGTSTTGTSKQALQSELTSANTSNSQSSQAASSSNSALNDQSTFTANNVPQ